LVNRNVLSERYVTPEINAIWSPKGTILAERELWIAVMKAQRELGLDIPAEDIEKFERAKEDIDLEFIEQREFETRHDVKAKIEAFVKVAGAKEYLHRGLTSRDLTDNVEQMQIKKAAQILRGRYVSILHRLLDKSDEYKHIELTARTHHQPAQLTLLGRRMSMWGEDLVRQIERFNAFIETYPLRGIKGPIGTQTDMLALLGDQRKVEHLESSIRDQLGFSTTLEAVGQVYFRSLDAEFISLLGALSQPCENFGKGMRLMAGYELVTEGFKPGQVGSSAMPHKMNTRSSERVCGLARLLRGYTLIANEMAGDTWEEGDVSCSVVRRVILPDSCYVADGMSETMLTILNEMGAYEAVISKEVDRYLPFLATTAFLIHATSKGIGREEAHKTIGKYAVAQALAMRDGREAKIVEHLADDELFKTAGITSDDLFRIIRACRDDVGNAYGQIDRVKEKAAPILKRFEKEAQYEPRPIR